MFLAIFAFAIFTCFLFLGETKKVNAGTCYVAKKGIQEVSDKKACDQLCKDNNLPLTGCAYNPISPKDIKPGSIDLAKTETNRPESWLLSELGRVFKGLLESILKFVGWLFSISQTLFGWIVDAEELKSIIDNRAIYEAWKIIRDLLNISFILVLLFSAFSTIFQVEKYSYKKILLTLVIMALLVNFSYPISRFFIDTANVLMYTVIKDMLGGSAGNTFANISGYSQTNNLFNPPAGATVTALIAAIVFGFIFVFTFLAVAVLLLIRAIALAILVIFSPLAFVASILPNTSKFSDQWWGKFFSYAFFGPIMMLMLFITYKFMETFHREDKFNQIYAIAQKESIDSGSIATIAFLSIPIILLWLGMGIAQQMGIAGAGAVMGQAKKAMGWVAKRPQKIGWWGLKKTGVPGGTKQFWDDWKKRGIFGTAATAKRESRVASKLGVKGAKESDIKRRAEEYKKNNESKLSLKDKAVAGDAAAALRLALDGEMDAKTYEDMQDKIKDPEIKKLLDDKISEKNLDVIVKYKVKLAATPLAKAKVVQDEYGKLDADSWKKQKNLENVLDPAHTDYDAYIAANAGSVFNMLHNDARKDIGKNSSGKKLSLMRSAVSPFNIP